LVRRREMPTETAPTKAEVKSISAADLPMLPPRRMSP
jgi:hypothetical protein